MFGHCISFLPSTFSFPLFLPFCFSFFFSFLLSHFPFIFSSFSLLLWSFSLPFRSNHSLGQKEEISSPFPQTILVALIFSTFIPYFFISFFFFNIINHMAQYGPWNSFSHTWLIVSHFFKWTTWLCQVSLLGCHVASPTLPYVFRHPTPRKT